MFWIECCGTPWPITGHRPLVDLDESFVTTRKRIALIAHDNCKPDLVDWARYNRGTLAQHELFATGTTLEMDKARQRYDGADDVNRARTCAAIASLPLSVLPKTTRT